MPRSSASCHQPVIGQSALGRENLPMFELAPTRLSVVLRLLHVSDIHFSCFWDTQPNIDVEREVRGRMLADIGSMARLLGTMDGVLVVGDVASKGKDDEYSKATEFLESVTSLIGCQSDRVVCVPGNHDVDRGKHNAIHGSVRQQLRTVSAEQVSDTLAGLLLETGSGETLLAPFDGYNRFALPYQCDISASQPTFAPKTFPLGETTVQVHGVNSAWIADGSEDTDDAAGLVAGLFQLLEIRREPGVVAISLCHHPPRWLRDAELLAPWFAGAHLVLTGHEHEAGVYESADGRTLYVASGAVNPSRSETGWIPAYNVIELDAGGGNQELRVTVHTRTWQTDVRAEFGYEPSRGGPETFSVDLRPPAGTTRPAIKSPAVRAPQPEPVESADHTHAYAVMRAAPDARRVAARALGLLDNAQITGLEADRRLLQNGLRLGRLSELAARLMEGSLDD